MDVVSPQRVHGPVEMNVLGATRTRWAFLTGVSRRRGNALFAAAAIIALVFTLGVARLYNGVRWGDIEHYVFWTRLVTVGGVQNAYSGTFPQTYAVYPPVTLYGYQLVGNAYRVFVDPTYGQDASDGGDRVRWGIRLVALAWHLLTAAAIYGVVRRTTSVGVAGVAGALYAANPGVLLDVAHWAQPDGAHSLFCVLAVGCLSLGHVRLGWGAIGLAVLTKPQALAIVPILALASWWAGGSRRLVVGATAAGAAGSLVVLPFVVTGRLGELLGLPIVVSRVSNVVTANAHNLWWLTGAHFVPDTDQVVGPLTYGVAALALVAAVLLLACWLYRSGRVNLAEAVALGALGWFVFTTRAHENHLFFAIPLLAVAWPQRPRLLIPFAVVSVSLLLNIVLHDELLLAKIVRWVPSVPVSELTYFNAWVNVLCLIGWVVDAARRRPSVARAS